ncbi:hypothetical protein A3F52_04755 [Candidatus Uhrbacteria bacterium RIFCSPHIGHO2_12_FULL_47_11]|nr:MAG: hypothetical protein A3F52_04755 [Candidatus Uhrbacteria bacterium RIFCSPHIGHO2_12_FULL_47_11]
MATINHPPLVSVLLPIYNQKDSVVAALQSVLNQEYPSVEILILDDASTDCVEAVLQAFCAALPEEERNKINYLKNEHNLRLQKNLNRGIREARGSFIARIDGDDRWTTPDKLERQISFLVKNRTYALVGGWGVEEKADGTRIVHKKPETDTQIRNSLLIENPFFHGSVVFRKVAFSRLAYDESLTRTEDYELWMRVGLSWKMYNFPEVFQARHDFSQDDSARFRRGSSHRIRIQELRERCSLIMRYRHYYPHALRGIVRVLQRFVGAFLSAKIRNSFKRVLTSSRTYRSAHLENITVLHMINQTNYGGAQRYLLNLAVHQVKKGWRVVIGAGEVEIDRSFVETAKNMGADFAYLPHVREYVNEYLATVRSLPEIRSLIRRVQPDIIHTHSLKINFIVGLLNWSRIPHLHTVHVLWIKQFPRTIKKLAHYCIEWVGLRLSTVNIFVCAHDQRLWQRIKLLPRSRESIVIHNVPNPHVPALDRQEARLKLGQFLNRSFINTTLIGIIGHLNPVKGHDTLLEAVNGIADPNLVLVIIGDGPLGALLQLRIANLDFKNSAHYRLSDHVFFTGTLPNASQYLRAFDLFVFPSEQESLPYALLEASISGIPVVASNVGGIPEVEQANWILIPPRDSAALAIAIERGLGLSARIPKSNEESRLNYRTFMEKINTVYTRTLMNKT